MENFYLNWGWFFWYSIFLLFVINIGNWGYTYRAHRKLTNFSSAKNALDILNERYARGDIEKEEYLQIKSNISSVNKTKV